MKNKVILIVVGEPYSTFSEIIGKYFIKKKKRKKKVILIGSVKLLENQLNKLNLLFPINEIENINQAKKNIVNIINIDFDFIKTFDKISNKSNYYVSECFKKSFQIINNNNTAGLINGPISKKTFLKSKFQGITEFLSNKFKSQNNFAMLIFNKKLSVSPCIT